MVRLGKGKKDRMVPIGERALQWVDKYRFDVRPQLVVDPSNDLLFVNHVGQVLGMQWLSQKVRDYVIAAGLGKIGSCHLFRHTMATLMLDNGADVRYIQALLGHSNLETTQVYTHVAIRQLKAIHEATHPASRTRAITAHQQNEVPKQTDLLNVLAAEREEENSALQSES
jgi:integrase/recombinase XerD